MPNCQVNAGDIVFPHRGAIGEVGIVPDDGNTYLISSSLMKIKLDRTKSEPDFIYYYFSSQAGREEILKFSSSVGTPGIGQPLTSMRQFKTPLFSLQVQKAIASILGSLDDKIDLNRRTNETLEAMARAMFRDWFVDFGPTRAKMAGETPYLTPELWELFPDRLDNEEKPEEWLDGTIGNWANLNSLSWKRQNYPETVNYLDLSSVKHGIINDISQISAQEAPSRAQRILRTGETVIGTVRPGNGSYAYIDREGLTGSTGFACFYAEDKKFREFVYFALTDKENIDRLTHLADGGAYPAVRPDVVADTACTLSEQTVSAFHTVVSSWMNKISTNNIESHTLAQLRDLLLPKLMSGEISIRDAEKMVEDAA
jgi:type I restriction enzyme S subunit